MESMYNFEYINENEYKKLERSVKKYNMLAYKKLVFEFYPMLTKGNLLGELVSSNKTEGIFKYELKLPTDIMFTKVHGEMKLFYTVYETEKKILLEKIEPEELLSEGHRQELETYKGVMVSKENQNKDMFKINLLNMLD